MTRKSMNPLQRLIDDLKDIKYRLKRLETSPRLQNASIDDGALWVLSPEGLIVGEPGGGAGSARVYGVLLVDGQLNITGPLTVEGTWDLQGNGEITGDVDVTGDIDVLAGGRIKIGNITLNPTDEGGSLDFGGGKKVHAGSGYLGIYNGSSFVAFNSSGVGISGSSGPIVTIGSGGFQVTGLPTIPQASVPGSFPDAIVYWSGAFRRVV